MYKIGIIALAVLLWYSVQVALLMNKPCSVLNNEPCTSDMKEGII